MWRLAWGLDSVKLTLVIAKHLTDQSLQNEVNKARMRAQLRKENEADPEKALFMWREEMEDKRQMVNDLECELGAERRCFLSAALKVKGCGRRDRRKPSSRRV